MGKSKDLTKEKKAAIEVLLTNTKYSQRNIASRCGVSQSSVRRINQKLKTNRPTDSDRKGRCGRKKMITPRGKRILRNIVLEYRRGSANTIRKKFQEAGCTASISTVRRNLYDMGFKCRRPIKKPRLTPAMIQKRLAWANVHKHLTIDDWHIVSWFKLANFFFYLFFPLLQTCFSDESTFHVLDDKSQFVRRRPDEKFNSDCVVKTVKHPISVMVWSVISSKGLGRMHIVEGTMRQDQYRRVLESRLLPQLQEWFGNGRKVFMHDGAPCHMAKSIKKFLDEHQIPVLPWAGNSPDMNPIENVWEFLKRELAKEKITTKVQLVERIIYHWNHNQNLKQIALNCIDSMPRRVDALLKARGGLTKY